MTDEDAKQPTIADLFRRMADRLEHNADDAFGGCFLICPPEGGGGVIESLYLDPNQNPADFWILLQSKCKAQIDQIDTQNRQSTAFRR